MAGGLLSAVAGGLAGGGQAVQQNAMSRIDQLRQEALQKLSHGQAMARQEHDQQFRRGERIEGQEFTAGENQTNRQHDTSLAEMREAGANRRTSMQIGARGSAGALTDRDKYELDDLKSRMERMLENEAGLPRSVTDLSAQEKLEYARLRGRYERLLGNGGGSSVLDQLLAGEGGGGGPAPAPGDYNPGGDPRGGGESLSVVDLFNEEISSRRNSQEATEARRVITQAKEKADALLSRIERENAGGATPRGLLSDINQAAGIGGIRPETLNEAQQLAEELVAVGSRANVSETQKRWIAERLVRLQDAGVPLNLGQ
ncbi:hypothetical protein [Billgrantia sp. C5P2]|uniref:hypothetical protein n=1 Tax=Billgrantia sp. C5P2 TaxID=3436239 RepID=UPI003DA513F5